MKRSRSFRLDNLDRLEGRVVPSQVYFSPQTGIIDAAKGTSALAGRSNPAAPTQIETVTRTKLADGQVETTDITSTHADGVTTTVEVIHEPGGSTKTSDERSTTAGGIRTFDRAITLADGNQQTEVGTDTSQGSTATVTAGGVVQANPGSDVIRSMTTTFHHVITQAGLGSETIAGTSVTQTFRGRTITVTDQEVTHFDGTQDEVKLVASKQNGMTTTHKITTTAGGVVTASVSTSKLLVSKTS